MLAFPDFIQYNLGSSLLTDHRNISLGFVEIVET